MPLRERALRAWKLRLEACIQARSKMENAWEVEVLRRRNELKYGYPDGPGFEQTLARAIENGFLGDEAYEEIIRAALRTDPVTDQRFSGAAVQDGGSL
ncbi:MAG: hypothetical protein FJW34_06975 [Acidobacteria bacterium]|nr:hypothetical protein [Acidobacteriota bacterium]